MYYDDESVFDDADVDNMPVFSESRRFSRLDSYEKMLLRDYIRSCIREHREYSGRFPTENELVEIRKRAISVLEDEWHITLKMTNSGGSSFRTTRRRLSPNCKRNGG